MVARQGRVSPKERIRQLLGTFWWPVPGGVISRSNKKKQLEGRPRSFVSFFCGKLSEKPVDNTFEGNSWKAKVSNEPDALLASAKRGREVDAAWGYVLSKGA